jgi:hypothetical protein
METIHKSKWRIFISLKLISDQFDHIKVDHHEE